MPLPLLGSRPGPPVVHTSHTLPALLGRRNAMLSCRGLLYSRLTQPPSLPFVRPPRPQGRLVHASHTLAALLGYSDVVLSRRTLTDLLNQPFRQMHRRSLKVRCQQDSQLHPGSAEHRCISALCSGPYCLVLTACRAPPSGTLSCSSILPQIDVVSSEQFQLATPAS
jgi:hypothetical protein